MFSSQMTTMHVAWITSMKRKKKMQGHTKMEKFNQVFKSQTTANHQQQTSLRKK
jgi:hypothetical protein